MGVKEQGVRLNNKGEVNTSLYSWGWDGKRQNLGTPTPAVQLTVHHVNTGWRDKTQSTHSNAHESLSIFIILKNSSILKFSVMICPMTKHFSQFPFSQSCIKFQVVWFLPGPGEGERWGQESGVCLSTRASIDLSSSSVSLWICSESASHIRSNIGLDQRFPQFF